VGDGAESWATISSSSISQNRRSFELNRTFNRVITLHQNKSCRAAIGGLSVLGIKNSRYVPNSK
jgi:hypothetical protein